jgi:hypothetical protein
MEKELEVREGVEQVSVDMWGGFPKVIEKVFPNAVIVTDRFHVMKALNEELNKIRKQTKLNVKIKGEKWLLLKNKEDLKEEELEKLELVLKQSARLRKAYEYKESFREIYEKVNVRFKILTFPVKSKIQQCKLLEALSGKGLRNDSLDRKKNILKPSSRLSFKFQKQRMKGV